MPSAPITIGITVTFMFHSFSVLLQGSGTFHFYQFYSVVRRDSKVHNSASSLFYLLSITRSGRLAEIRWSVRILKSQKSLCVSFCRTDSWLCIYHLFVLSNFNFLRNSQRITFSTLSCVLSYTLFVLICCIRVLCVWSFRLYHPITYICRFVGSYLFLLWYISFLWCCCVLLSEEMQVFY